MAKDLDKTASTKKKILSLYYTLFILLILNQIQNIKSETCSESSKISANLTSSSCFNEIIKFNRKYRSGQFTIKKDGVLLVEYSSGKKRLFYGLSPNGRGYFNDETNKIISDIGFVQYSEDGSKKNTSSRHQSKNRLVSLNDDSSKEYIFSLSCYYGLAELHDIDKDNDNYRIWLSSKFLGVDDDKRYVFSYQFSLLNYTTSNSNIYYAAYVQWKGKTDDKSYSVSYTLTKFSFTSMDDKTVVIKEFDNNYDNRIVSAFIMTPYNKLIVFFLKDRGSSYPKYKIRVHNLESLDNEGEYDIYEFDHFPEKGNGIFFKAIYLRLQYVAAIYFCSDNGNKVKFRIFDINSVYTISKKPAEYQWNNWALDPALTLNEFYKIDVDGEKFIFVSTKSSQKKLMIFFIDTQNLYEKLTIRRYSFALDGCTLRGDMAVDYFNDFLMFTSTAYETAEDDYYGILLFFSYPNGTDFYMNISPYVKNSAYYQTGNNLISYLISKRTIDNNIFGYTGIDEVKLISIPDEIIFYSSSGIRIANDGQIDLGGILNEDKNLIKYNRNYTLDYQYMVKDQETYNDMKSQSFERLKDEVDGNTYGYTQKTYYGRVNRLTFRLCHYYCESCAEIGDLLDINNQKCLTCLPEYRYDYYNFFNIYHSNCVPEGYYYDKSTDTLIECTSSNSKFYYNKTDSNNRICFDKTKECPSTYPYLNETNNQCVDYFPVTTTVTSIPTKTIAPITITPTTNTPTTITPTTITPITITPTTNTPTTTITSKTTTGISNMPTTLTNVPSTFANIIPSTISSTKITTIPTIIQTSVSTTTNIPSSIITTIPKSIITSIPSTIMTTIPEKNDSICTYSYYLTYNCSFENLNNTEILFKLKSEMLKTYPSDGGNVEIKALNGFACQFTNSLSQITSEDSEFSNIDLGECEALLKNNTEDLPQNASLIFFKYENIENKEGEKDIQYEVYNPINYEKLNLSICDDLKIKIKVPLKLSEEVVNLINNIIDQGYNPFDLNDKFYREICTPYNSENGTDVLLDDREEYIYSTIANETRCPSGCTASSYTLDSKYITCECNLNDTGIVAIDLKHISTDNIASSFLSTFKNTNYKVMRCYNLVFNFKIFCHNYGSIISLIFFVIYIIFMIYYCCNGITPLKVNVSRLLLDAKSKKNNDDGHLNQMNLYLFQINSTKIISEKDSKKKKKIQSKSAKEYFPPKKSNNKKVRKNTFDEKKEKEETRLIDLPKSSSNTIKIKKQKGDESNKINRVRNGRTVHDYVAQKEIIIKTKEYLINKEIIGTKINNKSEVVYSNQKLSQKLKETKKENKDKNEENRNPEDYDDYELNNMDYSEACDSDKRSCCRTYWSVIKREHFVLFTFISKKDFNLFYVKIERFFILICSEMAMNGMFFVHETMYKKKTGDTSYAQRIPQIIFSLLVSHVIEVILCYLGMTDQDYYEIKDLTKIEKKDKKVFDILKCTRRKLIGFYLFTFVLFLFYWYFISAFCAVYQNTQNIFLRDSATSILLSLIDPFFIYGFTCILRAISLSSCCRKKIGCLYKLSDIIPIF